MLSPKIFENLSIKIYIYISLVFYLLRFDLKTKTSVYMAQEKINPPPLDYELYEGKDCISSNYHTSWYGIEALSIFMEC